MSQKDSADRREHNASATGTIIRMASHYRWISRLIYAAAKLGVADALQDGPKSTDDLARSVGAHPRALYRVMRTLSSEGVFDETERGIFALNPLAETLRTGVPGSVRAWVIVDGDDYQWRPFGEILYTVRTGKPAFHHVFGMDPYEYLACNPEVRAVFNDAMADITRTEEAGLMGAYDFSGIEVLVDIGGGTGSLITTILKAHPQMRGILFDLPDVAERARPVIEAQGIAGRCRIIPGDMFDSVPEGADAYVMKHVMHQCDDNEALTLLRNCRRAIAPRGRLLVLEAVIPAGVFPDILMMVITGGQHRTVGLHLTVERV